MHTAAQVLQDGFSGDNAQRGKEEFNPASGSVVRSLQPFIFNIITNHIFKVIIQTDIAIMNTPMAK